MVPVDLRLLVNRELADVGEDEPTVVRCPPALRGDHRRALNLRLKRQLDELGHCLRIARELGDQVNAARIARGVEVWREIVETVAVDPR